MARDDDLEAKLNGAKKQLSALVLRRNSLLLRLDSLATLPLNITPASGHVAEFDVRTAQRLMISIEKVTVRIASVMDEYNQYAERCGVPEVDWLQIPRGKKS